jgi:carbon-monoxide dehydrogenase small subunit
MRPISLTINQKIYDLSIDDRDTLVDVLRDQCMLTATHTGCEHGACGACTVEMDGQSVRACLVLAVMAEGKAITTLEGLPDDRIMNELKRQFHIHHALQCGFCTAGFLMMGRDILTHHLASCVEPDFVRSALAGHICRCTGYTGIIKAITTAAQILADTDVMSLS